MLKYISFIMLLLGCNADTNPSLHDEIIQQDLQNKQYELNILRELYVAQQHNDEDAFKFYVSEYVRVPRLILTAEQKKPVKYKAWITDDIIKSGEFMDPQYDYITSETE